MPVTVHGLRELVRANAQAEPGLKREFRRNYRAVAEPVRATAEANALTIGNVPASPSWGAMRTGTTTKTLYVAPRQRGSREGSRKRPNLADLLMERAMAPALAAHEGRIAREFERFLDTMGRRWAR